MEKKTMNHECVFVDTGAWLALMLTDDVYHSIASQTLNNLLKSSLRLLTTNHVIGETYTFLTRIRNPQMALVFIENLKTSTALDYYFVDETMETAAYDLLRRYQDQKFSFVDATSFVVMMNLGLKKAFAFDKHFATAGFIKTP
jgi:predicted nucleic acid-binding protein